MILGPRLLPFRALPASRALETFLGILFLKRADEGRECGGWHEMFSGPDLEVADFISAHVPLVELNNMVP